MGAGIFALCAYLIVGIFIPLWNGRRGGNTGMEFRAKFGELNSYVLDSLRGLDETIQYGQGKNRERRWKKVCELIKKQEKTKAAMEGRARRSVTKSGDLWHPLECCFLCCIFMENSRQSLTEWLSAP